MKLSKSFIDPKLLSFNSRSKKLTVFLCGPGIGMPGFDARKKIKDSLTNDYNCEVKLGEDLDGESPKSMNRSDLQTLETSHAHKVDFTLLMLNSPGSIAELGTFSMIPNIMHRLYVIVPSRFFDSASYIARGPLSLMASASDNNIYYIDENDDDALTTSLRFPVMLYKYVKTRHSKDYLNRVTKHFRGQNFNRDDYQTFFEPLKIEFIQSLVASTIFLHGNPTFSEILNFLHLEPRSLNNALSMLFKNKKIKKNSGGRYVLIDGLNNTELSLFDKNKLSKRRSHQIAFS